MNWTQGPLLKLQVLWLLSCYIHIFWEGNWHGLEFKFGKNYSISVAINPQLLYNKLYMVISCDNPMQVTIVWAKVENISQKVTGKCHGQTLGHIEQIFKKLDDELTCAIHRDAFTDHKLS